jgi:hypothetical protein
MIRDYRQRSSWLSSLITGLVGWTGFTIIGALAWGYKGAPWNLFAFAAAAAIIQVLFMRVGFFVLQMHRHILIGAFWGGLIGAGLIYGGRFYFSFIESSFIYWLAVGIYIGAPVGAFLSYFYRDDKKLEKEQGTQKPDYGRDAHWLEPFAYGAVAYLPAFIPTSVDLAIYVFLVGAMLGVFAAGSSHFSPDKWKRSFVIITVISLGLGGVLGAATGLLFRQYADEMFLHPLLSGAIGGVLTYIITFLRGRQLARKEEAGVF